MKLTKRAPELPVYGSNAYCAEIRKFNSWLDGRQISSSNLLDYFQNLKVSPASKSVAKYAIKRVLKASLTGQNRMIDPIQLETVFKQIRTGKPKKKIDAEDLLTESEIKQIASLAPERTALLCSFLYATGLRIAEMASIELKRCTNHGGIVRICIVGKGSKERSIMVGNDLFKRVRKCFPNSKYLFGKGDDTKFTVRYLRQLITSTGAIVGKKVFPHLFRHSFATATIFRTNKIKAVSEYLGHSSPSVTLSMYVHQDLDANDLLLKLGA